VVLDPLDTVVLFNPLDAIVVLDPLDTVVLFNPLDSIAILDPLDTVVLFDPLPIMMLELWFGLTGTAHA
jgi:hypothetical protein